MFANVLFTNLVAHVYKLGCARFYMVCENCFLIKNVDDDVYRMFGFMTTLYQIYILKFYNYWHFSSLKTLGFVWFASVCIQHNPIVLLTIA